MSKFMSLPREIRGMIYVQALCVDGNIVLDRNGSECDGDFKGPLPALALLSVNKQIRAEGLPVLFSKNTWRITSNPPLLPIRRKYESLSKEEYQNFSERHQETLCSLYGRYFVKIVADVREIDRLLDESFIAYESMHGPTVFQNQDKLQSIRRNSCDAMTWMFESIANQMVWMTHIKSVVVYIEDLGRGDRWWIIKALLRRSLADFIDNKTSVTFKLAGVNVERKLVEEWCLARHPKPWGWKCRR